MTLPKHLRTRWRYLAVGIETAPDAAIDRRDVQGAVWGAARALVGDAGSADLDLTVVRFRFADGDGAAVVRTERGAVERARAALACVDGIAGREVGLAVRGVSGTVRACEEKYIRGRQEAAGQRRVVFEDAERSAVVRGERVDVRTDAGFANATALDL